MLISKAYLDKGLLSALRFLPLVLGFAGLSWDTAFSLMLFTLSMMGVCRRGSSVSCRAGIWGSSIAGSWAKHMYAEFSSMIATDSVSVISSFTSPISGWNHNTTKFTWALLHVLYSCYQYYHIPWGPISKKGKGRNIYLIHVCRLGRLDKAGSFSEHCGFHQL